MCDGVGSARRGGAGSQLLLACALAASALASRTPVNAKDERYTIQGPPGKPCNVTVTSGTHFAVLQWDHAPPEEGGLAIHYTFKWQEKDEIDASWFSDWVGVDEPRARLNGLAAGATYGGRIAAVNAYGRTWSDFVSFHTTRIVTCDDSWHWQGIMEEEDIVAICGNQETDDRGNSNPHKSPCSVTHVEYALAGIAAGSMIALLAGAVLTRLAWGHVSREFSGSGGGGIGETDRRDEEERLWEKRLRRAFWLASF